MRIRKLAKLHGFTLCNNNADYIAPPSTDSPAPPLLQSHICHLNQSPWDVVTFSPESPSSPPPAFQVDVDANNAPSFVDSTGAVESDVASMNDSNNSNNNNVNKETRPGKGNRRSETAAESSSGGGRRVPISKQTTNSYDFYYYSGFGPRWGKRRGLRNEIGIMEAAVEDELNADEEQLDYVELDEEEEEDDDDYSEDEREDGAKMKKKRGRKPIKARSLKSLM